MSFQFITQYDSPNYTPANQARSVWGVDRNIIHIDIHWWDAPENNPSFEGTIATLCNPSRGASANFVATGTGRRVACLVSPDDNSWCTNQDNPYSISIECDPRCRDEDYDVVAELIANIRSAYGDLSLHGHREFVNTTCPGNWDLARLDALARTKDGSGGWGVVTDKNPPKPSKVQATEAEIKQAYLDVLERPFDAGGLKTYLDADMTIAEVKTALTNSQEHSVLVNRKAAEQAKAMADAIAAEAKKKADDAQRILDEAAKQAEIDKAKKLAEEQAAQQAQATVTDNNAFVTWLKAAFEWLSKILTSWRK